MPDVWPGAWEAYGLQPPPFDSSLAGAPSPVGAGPDLGLHPDIAQAYGLVAPQAALTSPAPGPDPTPAPSLPVPAPAAPPITAAAVPATPPAPIPPFDAALAGAPPGPGAEPPVIQPAGLPPGVPDPTPTAVAPTPQPGEAPAAAVPAAQPVTAAAPPPARRPAPAGVPSGKQLQAEARATQAAADQAGARAIAEQEQVARAKAAEDYAAYQQHAANTAQIEEQRKALADDIAKARVQKQTYAETTLREAESYKVDRNKFAREMGLGDTLGWGIAAALSAVGQALARQGGPNPVIQMLQQRMHDAVVAQMEERDRLKARSAAATHELDKFDTFSKNRLAQIDLLDARNDRWLAQQIALTGAKMADPQARAAAQKAFADLVTSSAEKAQKAADTAVGHELQAGGLAVSRFNALETQRHNIATERLTGQQRDLEAYKLALSGKNEEAKLVRERAIGGEPSLTPVDKSENKPGEKYVEIGGQKYRQDYGLYRQKDGSTWIPKGLDSSVAELQKQLPVSAAIVRNIDEILKLGPEWLSDTANSDKKQRLDQIFGTSKALASTALGLGVPNGKDIEHILASLGTTDPSRFKDSLAGLKQARDTFVRIMSERMKAHDYDHDWKPYNPSESEKPTRTPEDQTLADALKNPRRAFSQGRLDIELGAFSPRGEYGPGETLDTRLKESGGVLPRVRQAILTWGTLLASPTPDARDRAQAMLERVAKESESPETAALAQQILDQDLTRQLSTLPGAPEVVRGSSGLPVPGGQ